MTIKVQNLSDLQDRRIMMEKKLPPYGYAFVILVGIFMLFLVVWSTHTNRIYVSQNAGTVQASNKTYIMSSYSGSITEMYISEGSYVNEGDLVAHIKSTDIDMQQDNLESQLKIYQTQLDQYNKLLQCVQDDTNYFSETNPEDQPYYYQYETYKSQVSQKTFDATAYQAAGYSDAQIKTMMEQSQSEVEALYYSTMQSISQSITSAQSNVDNVQAQLDALNTGANDYYIYAPTSECLLGCQMPPIRQDEAHRGHELCTPLPGRHSLHGIQKLIVVGFVVAVAAAVAGAVHAGRTAQRLHAQAGVIGDGGQAACLADGFSLDEGVLGKGGAGLSAHRAG